MKLTPEKRDMFTDAYRFYEKWNGMESTCENWNACAKEVVEIIDKHGGAWLIGDLMMALYQTIEREAKDAHNRSEEGRKTA